MEATKRTYQKHNTEKKITVKHYLNTSIKETDIMFGDIAHPIYVQVTYDRKTTKFRSHIPSVFSLPSKRIEHLNYLGHKINIEKCSMKYDCFINDAIQRDENLIKWLIYKSINIYEKDFQIHHLPNIYHDEEYKLDTFINWALNKEVQRTMRNIHLSRPKPYLKISNSAVLNFPLNFKSSPLVNLEFYLKLEQELVILKEQYSSQIWFFDIYAGIMKDTEAYNRENFIYDVESIRDIAMFDSLVNNIINTGQNMFYPHPYLLFPTIYDCEQKGLKEYFKNVSLDSPIINEIINDIDKLFEQYSNEYYMMIIKVPFSY